MVDGSGGGTALCRLGHGRAAGHGMRCRGGRRGRVCAPAGRTPVANPGSALVIESKRFPLTWPALLTPLPTWRALLPETRDPRAAPWHHDDRWLLKTAICNTGDTVSIRSRMTDRQWRAV